MLCRKCISVGPIREAELLFLMWNMGFITGIWTYTIVRFSKKSFEGFCLCRFWWAWNICRSVAPIAGKKKWREAGEKDRIHICLLRPPSLMTVNCRKCWHPLLCCCACTWLRTWRSWGRGPGGARGAAELAVNPANKVRQQISDPVCKLQWYMLTYTDLAASLPNFMHISLVANPNPEPYRKGN